MSQSDGRKLASYEVAGFDSQMILVPRGTAEGLDIFQRPFRTQNFCGQ
jgi:hypothetical protein